jgi:hypothetical protein
MEIYTKLASKLPHTLCNSIIFMQIPQYSYLDELQRNIDQYFVVIQDDTFNPHNYISFHNTNYDYEDEIYDDYQCNGRCCGNKVCGLGYDECATEEYRHNSYF